MASSGPPNFTSEYLNEYHGKPIKVVAILFIVLDTVFVGLRFLSRQLQTAKYGWDDYLIIPAWLSAVGLMIALLVMLKFGGAHHAAYFEVHQELIAPHGMIDLYVDPVLSCLSVAFPRLSILVLYLRTFPDRLSRVVCWLLCVTISSTAVVNVLVIIFQCNPRSKAWVPEGPGHCHNIELHFIWGTFPNLLTDLVMLILPLPIVYRLHAKNSVKLGLALTFLAGSLGMVTAIIRWTEFFQVRFDDGDAPWHDNPLVIWGAVEGSMYLISACMLTYRALFRALSESQVVTSAYGWIRGTTRSPTSNLQRSKQLSFPRRFSQHARIGSSFNDRAFSPFAIPEIVDQDDGAERGESSEMTPAKEQPTKMKSFTSSERSSW